MRIRLYRAFASNNSGSYTLVGSFRTPEAATEAAALLQRICDEHHAWMEATPYAHEGPAPLDAFVVEHGLTPASKPPGREDDWPELGDKPSVVASGHQVLFHVPYTVTMPPLFGELVYRRGGRVAQELDHSHHDLAVEFSYWPSKLPWNDPGKDAALDGFEALLRAELPALTQRREHDKRPPIEPAFHRGDWSSRHVSVVFEDLVEGVRRVRGLADQAAMKLYFRVWESEGSGPDPLAALRASERPWGRYRVILWQVGPDRIAAMKAVREALSCGLAEAKEALADLPREVLIDVDQRFAREAVEKLSNAGCDAEVVAPSPPR
jgi:ribosomal protein L7/L12